MRKILYSLGEKFQQTSVGSAMAVGISVLALLSASGVLDLSFGSPRQTALIVAELILLVGIGLFIIEVIGAVLIEISKQFPVCLKVVPTHDMDFAENANYAALKLCNRTSSGLSGCYAVLREAASVGTIRVPRHLETGKRLRWRENAGTDNTEISIAPFTGEATLRVLAVSVGWNPTHSFDVLEKVVEIADSPPVTYAIRIDFYGKMDGRDVKIRPFVGKIRLDAVESTDRMTFELGISRDRRARKGDSFRWQITKVPTQNAD